MVIWARGLAALGMALVLAACGGGGGGGGGSGSAPLVTLAPTSLTAIVEAGRSATLTVRATVSDPSAFSGTLYVYVVDSARVLTGTVNLAQIDDRSFSATVFTWPGLPVGRHIGVL